MSGKQKECGYSWTSEGEIHTCSLPEGHTEAHICGFVFNPSDCCLERAEPTPPEGEAVPEQSKCEDACDAKNGIHTAMCHLRRNPAAPVVSTAAPEPECPICGKVECMTGLPDTTPAPEPPSKCPTCGKRMTPTGGPHTVPSYRCFDCNPVAPESYKPAEGPELSELIAQQGIKPMKTGHELEIPGLSDEDMEGFPGSVPAATPVTVEKTQWTTADRDAYTFLSADEWQKYKAKRWPVTVEAPETRLELQPVRNAAGSFYREVAATPKPIGDVEAVARKCAEVIRHKQRVSNRYRDNVLVPLLREALSPFFAPAGPEKLKHTNCDQNDCAACKVPLPEGTCVQKSPHGGRGMTLREVMDAEAPAQPPCSECATLRKERDDAETNVKDLEKQLAEINAPGYACGLLFGMGQPFVGGCGKEVLQHESYRCADCTAAFHRACINDHFESDAYLKALRDERNQQPLKDWKESHAKEKARAEAAEAQLSTLRDALRSIEELALACIDTHETTCANMDGIQGIAEAALAPTPEVAPKE